MNKSKSRPAVRLLSPLSLLAALLMTGCAGHSRNDRLMNEETLAPRPPAFLLGATAALFTNSPGLSAQLILPGDSRKPQTGTLLARGSHLMFAPTKGDRIFIWDVTTHRGYVLSESLQGYAPITSDLYVTGTLTKSESAGPVSDQVNGYRGHQAEVMVNLSDGSQQNFTLWRTAEWQGFPAQITPGKSTGGVINLKGITRANLPDKLFQPPDGFTGYATLDSMTGEYVMRRSKVNTKATIEHPDDSIPGRPGNQAAPPPHL